MDLGQILNPLSTSEFLGGYFSVAPLFIRGSKEKFARLMNADAVKAAAHAGRDAITPGLDESDPRFSNLARRLEHALEAPVRIELASGRLARARGRAEQDLM